MIKKIILLLGAFFITAASVSAQSEVQIQTVKFNPIDVSISVSGNCDGAKSKQYFLAEIINDQSKTIAAEQSETENTSFVIKNYLLPSDLATGYYSVRVSVENEGEQLLDKAFYYGGKAKAIELLNSINDKTSYTDIDSIITANHEALAFAYIDTYNKSASKSMMLANIINTDLSADESNVNEKWQLFLDVLSKDTLLTYFSDTDSPDEIKSMLENELYTDIMGFNLGTNEIFKLLNDEGRTQLYSLVASDNFSDLSKSFDMLRENIFVAFLKTARYTDAEKAFLDIDDLLSVDYSVYNTLSTEVKNDVMKQVVQYAEAASDAQDIIDYFEQTAKSKKNQSTITTPPSGGSSGGGGGGSTGGYLTTNVTPQQPVKLENKPAFTDIAGVEWAKDAITALANKGVINGVGDGLFAPNDTVTRAQLCKMAAECFGLEVSGSCHFIDVSNDAWYAKYVSALSEAEIINGVGDGRFAPDSKITRQDLAVILYRIIQKYGYEMPQYTETEKFADDDKISDYANEAIYKLCGWGLLSGIDGNAAPLDNATRAQVAVLIYRIEVAR